MNLNVIQCENHYKGVCIKASNLLGTTCIVTHNLCDISCKDYWHGPYNGRKTTDEQLGFFAKKMLNCAWKNSVEKVRKRYSKPIEVWIPDITEEIKSAFAHITALPWVDGIALTGSILGRGLSNKDLDVVLIVKNLRSYIDFKDSLDIPKEIAGLKVDMFASEQKATFFMSLHLNDFVLYKSGLYNTVSIDPRIKSVVDTGKEIYATFRE